MSVTEKYATDGLYEKMACFYTFVLVTLHPRTIISLTVISSFAFLLQFKVTLEGKHELHTHTQRERERHRHEENKGIRERRHTNVNLAYSVVRLSGNFLGHALERKGCVHLKNLGDSLARDSVPVRRRARRNERNRKGESSPFRTLRSRRMSPKELQFRHST